MEQAGQLRIVRAEDVAHMGITEVVRHAPFIYAQYRKLVTCIRRDRPDIAVLIDFPDVNFRLARHLANAGVPVLWFVSPQLWAWKRRRLRWVQERVSQNGGKMLVIFPFEETFYRERGVDALFVGHPLATLPVLPNVGNQHQEPQQEIQTVREVDVYARRDAYAREHNLDPARTWIALLPGSRWKEIRANLPALHELAMSDLIASAAAYTTFDGEVLEQPRDPAAHARYEFLLPVASTIQAADLQHYIGELNREHLKYFGPEASTLRLTLVPDAREALLHARASVVASGTATVLAAVVGNPFVVVYRVSPVTFALAKRLIRYPEEFPDMRDAQGNVPVAMVNLVAGRRIVPELLQEQFTAANVASALAPLLADSPQREAQRAALAEVRRQLLPPPAGEPGALASPSPIRQVAQIVLSLLSGSGTNGSPNS